MSIGETVGFVNRPQNSAGLFNHPDPDSRVGPWPGGYERPHFAPWAILQGGEEGKVLYRKPGEWQMEPGALFRGDVFPNGSGGPMSLDPRFLIRAHEVGEYVFCARAWWHRRQGHPSAREEDQRTGHRFHARLERQRRWGNRLIVTSALLAIAGLALLIGAMAFP